MEFRYLSINLKMIDLFLSSLSSSLSISVWIIMQSIATIIINWIKNCWWSSKEIQFNYLIVTNFLFIFQASLCVCDNGFQFLYENKQTNKKNSCTRIVFIYFLFFVCSGFSKSHWLIDWPIEKLIKKWPELCNFFFVCPHNRERKLTNFFNFFSK